ncbi:hypothetical protein [Mucilaginibacter sp. SP1R1]|uniref:hypothetical protein n=1 Tax=Mucilaginibacter sp. SP1R1 TaxID=2723091 RepID=UPI0016116A14|nr:hypothetical protein [Mucilaginibacter sp. SP1R1]MBB6149807.1 hypothetical protein [Mucilaginibacter sp. SP1R1]
MSVFKLNACIGILIITLAACSNPKPKPVSGDISKTTVQVAGKKDSVINNPQKNYGAATVADPCVKCLLQVIQASKSYKDNTASVSPQEITYTVNWVKASAPAEPAGKSNATTGLRVDVRQNEDGEGKELCAYVYNNQTGTMYLLTNENKYEREISSVTPDILKKIRNSCYWGVASGK